MYLIEEGIVSKFYQYECSSIPQVKNLINKLTKTNSTNSDWKDICKEAKKQSGEMTVDYTYFDKDGNEKDCYVCIGYDNSVEVYIVWIECD